MRTADITGMPRSGSYNTMLYGATVNTGNEEKSKSMDSEAEVSMTIN